MWDMLNNLGSRPSPENPLVARHAAPSARSVFHLSSSRREKAVASETGKEHPSAAWAFVFRQTSDFCVQEA